MPYLILTNQTKLCYTPAKKNLQLCSTTEHR